MKKKNSIFLLIAGLVLASCDPSELVEVNTESTLSQPGFYTAKYSTKGKTLKVDVTKETSDSDALLVVNVDEVSDTIQNSFFTRDYSLSSGSHTLSIEAGRKLEGGNYSLSVNSKTSTTITVK